MKSDYRIIEIYKSAQQDRKICFLNKLAAIIRADSGNQGDSKGGGIGSESLHYRDLLPFEQGGHGQGQ